MTHRVLSIHIRHPIASDQSRRPRARASDASVVDRAFARADVVGCLPRASSRPPPRRRRATVVRRRRPRPRASPRASRARARPAGRTNERTTTIERSNDRSNARDPPDIISPRIHARSTRPSRRRARPRVIHPSIHPCARARSADPGSGSNRDRAHLLFLGRLARARDDDASGASSGVRGRVDRARLARACVIARVVANIVGVCRPRARATGGRDGRGGSHARDVMSMGSEACTLCVCVLCMRDGVSWCLTMGSRCVVYTMWVCVLCLRDGAWCLTMGSRCVVYTTWVGVLCLRDGFRGV